MVAFKIKSGHYYNLTYTDCQEVIFDFNILNLNDVEFLNPVFDDNSNITEKTDKEYIIQKRNFIGKFNSYSRIDRSPIFIVESSEIRNVKINDVLSNE